MKLSLLLLAALGLLLGADDPAKELERLQGTWTAVSVQEGGREVTGEAAQHFRLIVRGDKFAMKSKVGDQLKETAYTGRLDPTREPKAVDLTDANFDLKESVVQGIYEQKGEVLKLRLAKAGQPRPPGFAVKSEPGWVLLVLQRAKP